MAQTLKRTFHGCLTCRRRKVRCLGGNPCLNCCRMNVACHSSFDTNLRIRVSTPTGQKDLETRSAAGALGRIQQTALTASVPRTVDGGACSFAETVPICNPHGASVGPGFPGAQMPVASAMYNPNALGSFQLSERWDLGTPAYTQPIAQYLPFADISFRAAGAFPPHSVYFDSSAGGVPDFHHTGAIFSPEEDFSNGLDHLGASTAPRG